MGHRLSVRSRRVVVCLLAAALGAALVPLSQSGVAGASGSFDPGSRGKDKDKTTDVHVLAWNDFHGNLEPTGLNIYGQFAGGAAWLAKAVEDKQAQYGDREITVFAGDNIGASPLVDGLFFGEPSTIIANLMHTDFASVGNHEFDKGKDELLRIQNGGCRADVGCTAAPYALANGKTKNKYPGADFQYLSANVVVDATGKTLFPAYGTKRFKGDSGKKFEVGIIGAVLEATPTIVTPTGVAGLTFEDEADAVNQVVHEAGAARCRTPACSSSTRAGSRPAPRR